MAGAKQQEPDQPVSPKDTEERRDAILRRMLNTPPKPRKGKGEVKKPPTGKGR